MPRRLRLRVHSGLEGAGHQPTRLGPPWRVAEPLAPRRHSLGTSRTMRVRLALGEECSRCLLPPPLSLRRAVARRRVVVTGAVVWLASTRPPNQKSRPSGRGRSIRPIPRGWRRRNPDQTLRHRRDLRGDRTWRSRTGDGSSARRRQTARSGHRTRSPTARSRSLPPHQPVLVAPSFGRLGAARTPGLPVALARARSPASADHPPHLERVTPIGRVGP